MSPIMSQSRIDSLFVILSTLAISGCGREPSVPTQPDVPPLLAPGNTVDTDSRANLVWADNVLVGGIPDGRKLA
jgi:hypothetical protein